MSGFAIGGVRLAGRAVLAPMAGVSDAAFRSLCLEHGAALVYTEMVSAKALCYNDRKTAALLYIPEKMGRPVAAQIFGHEPEAMAMGARRALELSGAELIDINMGCPVGKIVKGGDGSALMRSPELAGEIVSAVVKAVDVPVTVKMRKGWDSGSVNCVELARACAQAGASAITRDLVYSRPRPYEGADVLRSGGLGRHTRRGEGRGRARHCKRRTFSAGRTRPG